jgi:diphthamide synthase (EF-2-diphthine--ammonia ligase)
MKTCISNYSVGKDSHIAIYKAKIKGYNIPYVFTLNGGKEHFRAFNNFINVDLIKEHCRLMGINLVEHRFKVDKKFFEKGEDAYISVFCSGIKKVVSKLNFQGDNITFFSSIDYELEENDKILVRGIKKFLKESNIKFYSAVKGRSTLDILELSLKLGIKSLIIGVERNIDIYWLGKIITYDFIDYIINEKNKGNFIDTNDFQTLVIESPLMKKRINIKDFDIIYDPLKITTSILLKIKKFEIC